MDKELYSVCAQGLTFFGKTNRLISHEMKNVLAIISETLGLLNELVEMAEDEGMKLPPGKLKSLSKGILEEMERANVLTRDMNAFAHSVDEFIDEVDVAKAITLMIKIVRLNARFKSIEIDFTEGDAFVVASSPFFLNNVLYHAICFALAHADAEKGIGITLASRPDGVQVQFTGLSAGAGETAEAFPDAKTQSVMNTISAKAALDPARGELSIILPKEGFKNPIYYLKSGE